MYIGAQGPSGGNGATNITSLRANIWSAYQTLSLASPDGYSLRYFGSWAATIGNSTYSLVATHDGNDYAWANSFVDALRAWGDGDVEQGNLKLISSVRSSSKRDDFVQEFMLFQGWYFNPCNENLSNVAFFRQAVQQGFLWWNLRDEPQFHQRYWANNSYSFPGHPEVWMGNPPTAGQNNTNTPTIFRTYAVVEIGGLFYDPSHGLTFTSLQNFQDIMISGFMRRDYAEERHFGFDANENGVYNLVDGVPVWLFRQTDASQLQIRIL